ncbi:MAG: fibronectin type III domain-containing protein [Planctomycetia bacterium]|nr:fibronectin type III domain-containing protein [Planctomycetia bacterium]
MASGGAIQCENGGIVTLTNCAFYGNYATAHGGAFDLTNTNMTLTNCTIAGNTAKQSAAGIRSIGLNAQLTLTNSIVSKNYGENIFGSITSSNSSILGIDPWFVNSPIFDSEGNLTNSETIDLRLVANSWGINTGDNSVTLPAGDLNGKMRRFGSGVDIGAYEYQNTTAPLESISLVVNTELDAFDPNDNKTSLREALFYVNDNQTITFDASLDGKTIYLDGAELIVSKAITIDASSLSNGLVINGGQKSGVFAISGGTEMNSVKLYGLTISGGNATYGGGGIISNGDLYIERCNITENHLTGVIQSGGAILNYALHTLTMINCSITNNSAKMGGGLVNGQNSTLVLTNCLIANNTSSSTGGGIYNYSGTNSIFLTNCTISGNSANRGGGIYNGNGVTATVTAYNCIIAENKASEDGNDFYQYVANGTKGSIYAYHTLSSYNDWTESSNTIIYDATKPLFADAANHSYNLAYNSQAIDQGYNSYVVDKEGNPIQYDLLNMPRIYYEIVDLGAYEYQLPNAPTNVHFGTYDPDTRSVEMYWTDNADNEDGFRIEYTINGTTWALSQFMPENTEYRLCSNMRTDKIYQYRIRTYNVYGTSAWAYGSVSTQTIPNAPGNVRFENYNPTAKTVQMFWDDNSNNEKGFRIEYSMDNGATWRFSQLKKANETSRTCTGLIINKDFMFRVRAYNDSGSSDWAVGSFSTKFVPAAPTDVIFSDYDHETGRVEMSWNDNSMNEKGFRIEYSTDNGTTWRFSQFKKANETSRTCTGLGVNRDYMFRVRAYNDSGSSDWAVGSFSTKFVPVAPTEVIFSDYDAVTKTVVMSWTDNSHNEKGFCVEYSIDNGTTWRLSQFKKANETSRTCSGIKADTTYMFRVRAYNDSGSSDWAVATFVPATIVPATFVPEATSALQTARLFDSIFEEEKDWF